MKRIAIISCIATILLSFVAQAGYGMKQEQQLDIDTILKDRSVRQAFSGQPVIFEYLKGADGSALYTVGDGSGKALEVKRRKGWHGYILGHVLQDKPFAKTEYEQIKRQQTNLQGFIWLNPSIPINYDRAQHRYIIQGQALKKAHQ